MFFQSVKKLIGLFAVVIVLASCRGISFSETHFIEIDYYENREQNDKLVEEIFNYGPEHIISNIPSFTSEMNGAVTIGYMLPDDFETAPKFKYTLKSNVPAVAKNKQQLKRDFEAYIPKLMRTHISKKPLYDELAPIAEKWLISVFKEPLENAYPNTTSQFKELSTEEDFIRLANGYKSTLGDLLSTDYLSGYYVGDYKGQGEVVAIMFLQKFDSGRETKSQVILKKEDASWGIFGYKLYSQP